jgi:Sec-independent protein translocase protein TatA
MILYTIGIGELILILLVFFGIILLVSFRRWPNFFRAIGKGVKTFLKELK